MIHLSDTRGIRAEVALGLLCLMKDDGLKQSDVSTVVDFWYGNRKSAITVANTAAESEHK